MAASPRSRRTGRPGWKEAWAETRGAARARDVATRKRTAAGVQTFVDLTDPSEAAPYADRLPAGVRHLRFPIPDFDVPTPREMTRILNHLDHAVRRRPPADLMHHSDQGSQYTAGDYQQILKDWEIQVSMNGVGSWSDNSPMESFFGTLKSEWVYRQDYRTRAEVRVDLFYYIEAFYNRRRLHSSIDYCSPEEYEQLYYEEQFA